MRFRASPSKATEVVGITSGVRQRTQKLQPGDDLSLRVSAQQQARVAITPRREARRLHAEISLGFPARENGSYCWPFLPPTVSLSLRY